MVRRGSNADFIKNGAVQFILIFLIVPPAVFLTACNVDLFGIFASSSLEERLLSRNDFTLLKAEETRNITLGEEYSFLVLSDAHIENQDADGLEKLKEAASGSSFVVFLGDITQFGDYADLQIFIHIAKELSVPCYPVIGNHDVYFSNWAAYKELIGSSSYKVSADSAAIFFLDSANGTLGSMQLKWLNQELLGLKEQKKRVFVFTHTNLFVKSLFDHVQWKDDRERAKIISVLKDKCDVFFMGHVHREMFQKIAGVEFVTLDDYKSSKTYVKFFVTPAGFRREVKKL
ncbi:MAG: metallophosphoesterase [Spirochaetaceae bacterium]|jgi:3',5'-cyclic AMP phosphodiesterase CpdA|nr:metallophosphoesterase [Spirochaetaceae bacterium]